VIGRVRDEVHEGHENAEGAEEARRVEADELPRAERFLDRGARHTQESGSNLRWIAVGTKPAIARIILYQERHASAGDHCEHAEDKIGLAPANIRDQERRQGWHDQRTEADAARRNAGGQTTAPREPAWHRADRRHIGASDAEADAEPVGGIDLEQALRRAGGCETRPDQNHADQSQSARAEAVGERSADAADAKIEEAGKREDKRN
jgi:hypothetical protein